MGQPTTTICCDHCGAPLKGTGKRTVVTCGFCGREQSLRAEDPEEDEEVDEDAPDSEPWDEDAVDEDEGEGIADENEGPLDVVDCVALLRQHVGEVEDQYDAEEMLIELDEENTDDERVYLYLKDEDGDVLDYFFVDREAGTIEIYDYDNEAWEDA